MDKLILNPESVRGHGNIVSPKSSSDFMDYNCKIIEDSSWGYGTVYSDEYLAGASLVLSNVRSVYSDTVSFTVSAILKDNSDTVISGATLYCEVNGGTTSGTTDENGEATFTILCDDSVKYSIIVYYKGTVSVAGCFATTSVVLATVPESLVLQSDKTIIQSSDKAEVWATLLDSEGKGVPMATVNFYEQWTPGVRLTAESSIIQSGTSIDLTGQLVDTSDGSLVREAGHTIIFGKQEHFPSNRYNDNLTLDNHSFFLSDDNASLAYDETDGMKFTQVSGDNNSTFCYFPFVLDVVNQAYTFSFHVRDWSTTDNTPFRVSLSKADFTHICWMPLLNTQVGWLTKKGWTKNTDHSLSGTTSFTLHLEDGNYQVYKNNVLVASDDSVIGEPVLIGFRHFTGQYVSIKNLSFIEITE